MDNTRRLDENGQISASNMSTDMNTRILSTKLYSPPSRSNAVVRSRLFEKLKLYSGHKLTLISAPAGYGKTTLGSDWLRETQMPYAWISLENSDNDPLRFLMYLVAALQRIDKNIGKIIHSLVGSPKFPHTDTVMNILINDINDKINSKKEFALVLDDYHVIQHQQIHETIQYLLNHQPFKMHLMILTREQPPIMLSKLRSRGHMIELGREELCFREEEVVEFFRKTMELHLEDEDLKVLGQRTEGWIVGLQLAGWSLQKVDPDKLSQFIRDFTGSNRYVMDYLVEEILYQQVDSHVAVFLYHTSILDRFNASLCDAILEREDSKSILEYLVKANLFLVPLDDKGEWYRYHHLFSDFLRSGLGKKESESLHLKAAKWMEEQGYTSEAVEHAIKSGNIETAERLIDNACIETYLRTEFSILLNWIESLPEERVMANGNLSLYKAWCYFIIGRPEESIEYASQVENYPSIQQNSLNLGRLFTIQAAVLMVQGKEKAIEIAKEAKKLIGDRDPLFCTHALHALGHAYILIGNIEKAIGAFRESLMISEKYQLHTQYIAAAFFLSACLNKRGQRRDAQELCEYVIDKYKEGTGKMLTFIVMYVPLGMIYYDGDDLEKAHEYLEDGIRLCSQINILHIFGEGEWSLALLQYALGDKRKALKTLREAKQLTYQSQIRKATSMLEAMEIDINLREGNLEMGLRWAKESGFFPSMEIKPLLETQYIIYARILIAQNRLEEARILLNNLKISAQEGKRQNSLIKIYILLATVYKFFNDPIEALSYLEKAIVYAAPEAYYRHFLDEGRGIVDMLPSVRPVAPIFVDDLITKFQCNTLQRKLSTPIARGNQIQLLSEREKEILRLVSLGLSNDDIAEKLYIAKGTTKNHISNIYSKLGVKKRTQAIRVAKELDLIS